MSCGLQHNVLIGLLFGPPRINTTPLTALFCVPPRHVRQHTVEYNAKIQVSHRTTQ